MTNGDQTNATVTCYFKRAPARGGRDMSHVEIKSDTFSQTIDLKWPWAAPTLLRQDMIDLFSGLAGRCLDHVAPDADIQRSPNFIGVLPGLRFEDLRFGAAGHDSAMISLRLVSGQFAHLFVAPDNKRIDAPMEDVFLPLTNLSAYLRVMKDQVGDDGPARAMGLTADRLDEFLLVYRGRLQHASDHTGVSSLS